jgi:hypothetical protein
VIGGVAMALAFDARRTTKDADVILAEDIAGDVLQAAAEVAAEFGLPADWMNQKAVEASLVIPPRSPGRIVFSSPTLVLAAAPIEHLLAMKLAAFRDDTDIKDATLLLGRLSFSDVEEVWSLVGGLVPVAKRDRARQNLDALWEMVHEAP